MSEFVRAAIAGDIAEAEEMQVILRSEGIDSTIEQMPDADAVIVLVPEGDLDEAKEAIEELADLDDLSSEP